MRGWYSIVAILAALACPAACPALDYDSDAQAAYALALACQSVAVPSMPVTPTAKTCLCSGNCVCGCNDGQACDCRVSGTQQPTGRVGGMVCENGVCRMTSEPQYSSPSTPQTVTYSSAPASVGSCAGGNCGQSSGSSMTSGSCSSGSCSSGNCGSSGRVAILRRRR